MRQDSRLAAYLARSLKQRSSEVSVKKWPYSTWIGLGAVLLGLATILGVSFDSALLLLGLGLLGLASAIWGFFVGINRAASDQDNPEHHN